MAKKKSRGTAICMGCWELIDLDWFYSQKFLGPVVHGCGRVLYR